MSSCWGYYSESKWKAWKQQLPWVLFCCFEAKWKIWSSISLRQFLFSKMLAVKDLNTTSLKIVHRTAPLIHWNCWIQEEKIFILSHTFFKVVILIGWPKIKSKISWELLSRLVSFSPSDTGNSHSVHTHFSTVNGHPDSPTVWSLSSWFTLPH